MAPVSNLSPYLHMFENPPGYLRGFQGIARGMIPNVSPRQTLWTRLNMATRCYIVYTNLATL